MKNNLFFVSLFFLIFFQQLSAQIVSDIKVNDDLTDYNQSESKIGVDAGGNFIIAWTDQRRLNGSDVYIQRYTNNAVKMGANIKINGQIGQSSHPEICMKSNGNFFLIWADYIAPNKYYRLKYFNKNGDSISTTKYFMSTSTDYIYDYRICLCPDNSVIVSWLQTTESFNYDRICYQRFDSSGNKIGNNIIATDTLSAKEGNALCIRADGSFIIAWEEGTGGGGSNLIAQMFDSQGNKIGGRRQVNDNHQQYDRYQYPVISSDNANRFVIGFEFYNTINFTYTPALQLFNSDGTKKDINKYIGYFEYEFNLLKTNSGEMLTSSAGNRTYMVKADSSGVRIGNYFQVSSQNPGAAQFNSDYKIINNKIFSTWTDNRNGNNDIYCNIRSYINPDSVVSVNNISQNVPDKFSLYQNYPNPFNPTTKIKFDIPKSTDIKLIIFDAVGREVKNISQNNLTAGSYEYEFNGENLSSGIYYFKLQTNEFSKTMKMALVK